MSDPGLLDHVSSDKVSWVVLHGITDQQDNLVAKMCHTTGHESREPERHLTQRPSVPNLVPVASNDSQVDRSGVRAGNGLCQRPALL